jgi:hypothetical protein
MKYISSSLLYIIASVGLFSAISCSDSSEIGLSLVEQEPSDIVYTDTSTVIATTVDAQAVTTSNRTSMVCGSYSTPDWGESRASTYMNFRLRNTGATFPNSTLDSVVLTLAYETFGHYGDFRVNKPTSVSQVWEVARMVDDLQDGVDYKSDVVFGTEAQLLKSNFTFEPNDTANVTVDGVELPPHLRIRLDDQAGIDLGNTLLNPQGAAANIYASNTEFKDWFKGIHIRPAASNPSNGSIIRFKSKNSLTKLTVYYTDTSSGTPEQKIFDFLTNDDAEVVSVFEHTHPVELTDNLPTDTVVHIQGMDGLHTKVSFPFIQSLGQVVINRAQLVFTLVDTGSLEYPSPFQIVTKVKDAGGNLVLTDDVASSIGNTQSYLIFGGGLSAENNGRLVYSMSLSEELQNMVEGIIPENAVYLSVPSALDPERGILYNERGRFAAKLLLTYTRY